MTTKTDFYIDRFDRDFAMLKRPTTSEVVLETIREKTPRTLRTIKGIARNTILAWCVIASVYMLADVAHNAWMRKYPAIHQSQYSPQHWQTIARRYAQQYNVPVTMVWSVMQQENATYDPYLPSEAQALGLMQMLPTTWKKFKPHKHAFIEDGEANIHGGVRYLHHLLYEFQPTKGDIDKVLRWYNAGSNWNSEQAHKYSREVRSRMQYK